MAEWKRDPLRQDLIELGIVLAITVVVFVFGWWLTAQPQAQTPEGPIGMIPAEPVTPPGLDGGGVGGASTPPEAAMAFSSIPRTCALTVGPIVEMPWPAGYEGARVQITRNGSNHARSDASAPYGPFTATVNAGAWVLAAKLSKSGLETVSVPLGTAYCGPQP